MGERERRKQLSFFHVSRFSSRLCRYSKSTISIDKAIRRLYLCETRSPSPFSSIINGAFLLILSTVTGNKRGGERKTNNHPPRNIGLPGENLFLNWMGGWFVPANKGIGRMGMLSSSSSHIIWSPAVTQMFIYRSWAITTRGKDLRRHIHGLLLLCAQRGVKSRGVVFPLL